MNSTFVNLGKTNPNFPNTKKNKSDDDSDKNEQARFGPQLRIS